MIKYNNINIFVEKTNGMGFTAEFKEEIKANISNGTSNTTISISKDSANKIIKILEKENKTKIK